MLAHFFVLGFVLLLCWAMETTWPTGTKGIQRYK